MRSRSLFPYRFEELRVDDNTIRAHLKAKEPLFGDRIPATKPMLDRMTKHVEEVANGAGSVVQNRKAPAIWCRVQAVFPALRGRGDVQGK